MILQDHEQDFASIALQTRELRIAVGYQCNMRCPHCYSVDRGPSTLPSGVGLTAETYRDIINLFAQYSLMKISITGGEPFYGSLAEITLGLIREASRHNLMIRISTNGYFITPEIVKTINDCLIDRSSLLLQISLDGSSSLTHDKQRSFSGAFDAAINGIREARKGGLRTQVRYTLSLLNAHECLECIRLCEELQVEQLVVKPMIPWGDSEEGHNQLVPSMEQLSAIESAIRAMDDGITKVIVSVNEVHLFGKETSNVCDCGRTSLHITPDGNVYPCGYLAGVSPQEIWRVGRFTEKPLSLILNQEVLHRFLRGFERFQCPGAAVGHI